MRGTFEKNFYNNYRSIVVLSNPKTVLNTRRAKKEIRNQVIRADQLVEYIRKTDSEPGSVAGFDKKIEELAKFFLDICKPNPTDYTEKYRALISESTPEDPVPEKAEQEEQPPVAEAKQEDEPSAEPEQPPVAESEQKEKPSADTEDRETILCPRCGAHMVKRQAQKGSNAGKYFYGCSNFPKCRGIINIE
ncbi:MAG: topoisomerase DNA-binding C4 zinc finger domain-containing protein [Clostridiales bacterium]|nr:topoisomerase DNA-binding C4 zinc finger domain-containing protein [Clostridiales bacterium]